MTSQAPLEEVQRNRVLVVGALLVSSALVSVSRRWVKQLDPPPRTVAKLKWQQARAATTAGARAWRNDEVP